MTSYPDPPSGAPNPGADRPGSPGSPGTTSRPRPPQPNGFFPWLRRLDLNRTSDRWVGGVAGGIGRRLGIDPVLVRGIIIVLAIFGGLGVLLYGAGWLLLPEPDGRIHLEEAIHGRWTKGMTGAAIVSVLGLGAPGDWIFPGSGGGFGHSVWVLLWLGAVIALILWLVNERNKKKTGSAGSGYPGPGVPAGPDRAADPDLRSASGSPGAPAFGTAGYCGGAGYPAPPQYPEPAENPDWEKHPQHPGPAAGHIPDDGRFRRRGPAGAAIALTIGAALLVSGAVLGLDRFGLWDAGTHVYALAAAAAAAVLGSGIVVAGLRGRSSGSLGFLAVLALVATAIFSMSLPGGAAAVGTSTEWSPTSTVAASDGYSLAAGRGTIDLADINVSALGLGPRPVDVNAGRAGPVVVPINVAAANIKVIVPARATVQVRSQMAFGTVRVQDGSGTDVSGIWHPLHYTSGDAATPDIQLDVNGIFAEVIIIQAGSES